MLRTTASRLWRRFARLTHGRPKLVLPWKMYIRLLQLQDFGSHKKNQNRCHETRFTGSEYTEIAIVAGALPQNSSLGSLQCSLRHLPIFNGFASKQRRTAGWRGQRREEEGWRDRGRDRQEIEWGRLCLVLLEFLRAPMVWPYSQPLYRRK